MSRSTRGDGPSFDHIAGVGVPMSTHEQGPVDRATPDFLVVILDLNAYAWQHVSETAKESEPSSTPSQQADVAFSTLKDTILSVLVFLNAYTAMQHGNGLVVYGAATGTARLLYSSSPHVHPDTHSRRTSQDTHVSACLPFKQMDDAVFHGMHALFDDARDGARGPVGMVRALALALCHMHRLSTVLSESTTTDPHSGALGARTRRGINTSFLQRILVLSATPDVSAQYVPMMNCIFSAQKQGIQVDVCKLLGDETVFLRQACHLTGGRYFHVPNLQGLLQVLMTTFLPSRSIEGSLMFPTLDDVDFRAACFCHRHNVDIGYVCSVCLSSTCSPCSLSAFFVRANQRRSNCTIAFQT
mgnify:FL=1